MSFALQETSQESKEESSPKEQVFVKTTPMMQQWKECKEQSKDALLLFRLGDFYEAFYDDAKIASKELELTLTKRQDVPMCGIPWHTSEGYIERLVSKGYRVAIAEQMEDPKKAKGLVSRKLARVISPATHVPLSSQDKQNSFIASCSFFDNRFGLACVDIATAVFTVFECESEKELLAELFRTQPKELIIPRRFSAKQSALLLELATSNKLAICPQEDWLFDPVQSREKLHEHFSVSTLDGFGLRGMQSAITSAGALLQYIKDWLLAPTDHLKTLKPQFAQDRLLLDRATLVNLEILQPQQKNASSNTLLFLLDETKTAMGSRLIAQWVKNPLLNLSEIILRQDAIDELLRFSEERPDVMTCFDERLGAIFDLERQTYRIKTATAGPREYVSLRMSLEQLPLIKEVLKGFSCQKLETLYQSIDPLIACAKLIRDALTDEPPLRLSDGNLFRQGYSQELDDLGALRSNSQQWLLDYQNRLREETGIKTLKVGFNRMFGYYLEVPKSQIEKIPIEFERRQTLVGGERYVSKELKEYEGKVLSADERSAELELALFQHLRSQVALFHQQILQTAEAIAELDTLRSLSIVAKKHSYFRPFVDQTKILWIREGRHPVIEASSSCSHFVPNDIYLDGENTALMCLTGPNMAGKSTFIRQVALLVIMAQIGSFIPAKEARIGIVDQLFSRIGASDDLARGQSTFMVEMAETASILNLATDRSLVILDEIGRGTSTYDGISIAWAVAEYLLKNPRGRPKTLFATHYYELTALEDLLPGAVNYTVAISETKEGIQFLRKVISGKTDKSYGLHVAKIAGMPEEVLIKAEERLKDLERKNPKREPDKDLLSLLPQDPISRNERTIIRELHQMDIHSLTPLQIVAIVDQWQKKAKGIG
jgi:DNA mismatch repair protein MutS